MGTGSWLVGWLVGNLTFSWLVGWLVGTGCVSFLKFCCTLLAFSCACGLFDVPCACGLLLCLLRVLCDAQPPPNRPPSPLPPPPPRHMEELHGVIGYFVNVVALRTDLSGSPTFGSLVQRVSTSALAAFSNSDVPLQALVQALDMRGSGAYNPIFQVS